MNKLKSLLTNNAVEAAQKLLGWELVHQSPEGVTSGFIVETEAYDMEDAASHAYRGKTQRNASLFGPAGTIYVYFTYGMHYCFNIATGPEHHGQGVLIRALQPHRGKDLMRRRRGVDDEKLLCSGPARLVQAMGISKAHNGQSVFSSDISLRPGIVPEQISASPRIGITKDMHRLWRFTIADNTFVSRK